MKPVSTIPEGLKCTTHWDESTQVDEALLSDCSSNVSDRRVLVLILIVATMGSARRLLVGHYHSQGPFLAAHSGLKKKIFFLIFFF